MVNRRTDKKIIIQKCKPDSRTLSRLEYVVLLKSKTQINIYWWHNSGSM